MKCEHGGCHYREECGEKLVCRYDGEVISKEDKICHKYKGKYIDIGKDVRDMVDGKKYNVNFEKVKDAFGIKPNYQPPISELLGEITTEYIRNRENELITVVSQQAGYQVNKDKLLKALEYDRNQYMQGFNDARRLVFESIRDRCKAYMEAHGIGTDVCPPLIPIEDMYKIIFGEEDA